MGLVQKKDEDEERNVIDGVEVIGRGDVPDDLPEAEYEIHEGQTAEDISGTTARREAEGALETEPDPELVGNDLQNEDEDEPGEDAEGMGEEEEDPEFYDHDDDSSDDGSHSRTMLFVIILIIAVIIAAIVGYFIGSSSGSRGVSSDSEASAVSSAYLTEDELDSVVATWTYGGEEHSVTAQEAIESEYSLETVELDDGTYAAPSADTVITYARNLILLDAAEDAGISVDEEAAEEYAEDVLGSSDYSVMAETYGLTEEQAEEIVTMQATIYELYKSVIPEIGDLPDEPTMPDDGDEDTESEEYAAYIIELAGDEWDADAGTWASEDGPYYDALGAEDFTEDSATYGQALMAYYVAYEEWYEEYSEASSVWLDYENELFSEAEITIYGLYE